MSSKERIPPARMWTSSGPVSDLLCQSSGQKAIPLLSESLNMSFSFLQESQKAKALAKKNNIVEPTPYARKLSTDQLNSLLKRFPHPYPKSKRV